MDREQASRLIAAADKLPQTLGHGEAFRDGEPCCAVGHLASFAGVWHDGPRYDDVMVSEYGLELRDRWKIIEANDESGPASRRAAAIAEIERQIRESGFDPVALRAEVDANA